ncbi:tRNA (adenosine(37)-N6)-dimethylallyltransferase MiaA [Croceitalea sp. P059]|uniref:tRNA (adenosine(37)-N6)-dimethylallyltransferase MiaA n=1 Tax=Croceitalea sp. P059 TaxID=3075601 RepID=UPI0028856EF6|nr:tRNA (adenosine(37)-N6)-dimethylallyltransferase MiaA [Croceitalea sp. P059]MDT0539968.1 tRNA (adenosine(37)-N6)-dimethylallyltransferase MiaA [Croceitalea sp. P059]
MITKTLIAVIGPTAIGKTDLAIRLANHFQTEILSADSRQFYKEMTIGTAVPSHRELKIAHHHFIQHKSIFDTYSVGDFEKEAILKLDHIFKEKNIAILVGGSGLYIDAVVKGLDSFPPVPIQIREELIQLEKEKGLSYLQNELKKKDPFYFKQVDIENPHRVIRALEICRVSGQPYSSFLNQKRKERIFRTIYVGIKAERELIYERINRRVDVMMENGLLNEAKDLYKHKSLNALQTVGYKELFAFFDGKEDLNFAVEEIKKNTRRFAKRQLTWNRKNNEIIWTDFDEDISTLINKIKRNKLKQ